MHTLNQILNENIHKWLFWRNVQTAKPHLHSCHVEGTCTEEEEIFRCQCSAFMQLKGPLCGLYAALSDSLQFLQSGRGTLVSRGWYSL